MKLLEFIERLGFNAYEKEAFLYLATVSSATANEIYKHSRIPSGRIYSVLNALKDKGIVEVIPVSPKKYVVQDVKKNLNELLEKEKVLLDEKQKQIRALEIIPHNNFSDSKDPSGRILNGREEHLAAISSLLDEAKREIVQIAPLYVGNYLTRRSLCNALKRGVDVRVIIPKITAKNKMNVLICKKNGGQIRLLEMQDLISMMIKDESEMLLGVQDYKNQEQRMTLYTRNKALIQGLKKTFETLWTKAKPI